MVIGNYGERPNQLPETYGIYEGLPHFTPSRLYAFLTFLYIFFINPKASHLWDHYLDETDTGDDTSFLVP